MQKGHTPKKKCNVSKNTLDHKLLLNFTIIKPHFCSNYNAKYVKGMKMLMAFINNTAKRITTTTPKITALNGVVTALI